MFADGSNGRLDLDGAILAGRLKLVDAALAADEPHAALDAAVHAVGRRIKIKGGKDAALAIEMDLGEVLGVLFEVAGQDGERVVVGGAVELGGVEGIAAYGDGFLEEGEDFIVGKLGRAKCESCWRVRGYPRLELRVCWSYP